MLPVSPSRCGCLVFATSTLLALALVTPASATAAPRNDDFKDAKPLRLGTTVKGTINGASKERGEPRHANSLATRSVWYRFTSRRRVALGLGTCNSDFDSVIAVYTGRSLRGLHPVEFNNDGCGRSGGGSRVTFTARPGKVYRIAVAGFAPSGRFRLTVTRVNVPPNDDFVDAAAIRLGETIAGTSRNATRELGEPSHSDGDPHTVWFKLSVSAPATVALGNSGCGITIYTGRLVSSLTRVGLLPDFGGTCEPRFVAQPGVVYRIVVENCCGGAAVRLSARQVT